MNLSSSTLLALALKRLITYLVSLEVPPIASIKFTVMRDNDCETGFLIQLEYLQAKQKDTCVSIETKKDVKKTLADAKRMAEQLHQTVRS